jgi:hypothetical protein
MRFADDVGMASARDRHQRIEWRGPSIQSTINCSRHIMIFPAVTQAAITRACLPKKTLGDQGECLGGVRVLILPR